MQLTNQQLQQFDRDGFLVVPGVLSIDEVAILRRETERLAATEGDSVLRQGHTVNIYRAHELDGPTGSRAYHALARLPRILRPVFQILKEPETYIYNSHIFGKEAFTGAAMMWHQDYNYWRLDGVRDDNMIKVMIALGHVDDLSGCVWFVPGSHKMGAVKHHADATAQFKHWTVVPDVMTEILKKHPTPVPIHTTSGAIAFFHASAIHGSGHNLSASDRWQAYVAYNPVRNAPRRTVRPDRFCSTNHAVVVEGSDNAILAADQQGH